MYYQIKTIKTMTVAKEIIKLSIEGNKIDCGFNTKPVDIIYPDGEYEEFELDLKELTLSIEINIDFDDTNNELIITPKYTAKCIGKAWYMALDTQEHFGKEIDTYQEIEIDFSKYSFDFDELDFKSGITHLSAVIDCSQDTITFNSKYYRV